MTFDPLGSQPAAAALDDRQIEAVAQAAGERLLARLDAARTRTGDWQDAALGQMLVDHALSECMNRLAQTGCWGEANRLPSSVFWKEVGPVLEVGWLQHRARSKPLGYAGDYLMLQRIWEEDVCDHPLGRLFDRYFLALAAPAAVRARFRHVAGTLCGRCLESSKPCYRVVSVGSGPAVDLEAALAALPESRRTAIELLLLDLDPEALDHAAGRLLPWIPERALTCLRENLFRSASNPRLAERIEGADLIVCTGLFDYLDDTVAAAMAAMFWERLAPGGQLLIGNFAPHNPTRTYMEWIGNWYLRYRTAGELQQLATAAGIPTDQFSIRTEHTGVNLFLVAEKP